MPMMPATPHQTPPELQNMLQHSPTAIPPFSRVGEEFPSQQPFPMGPMTPTPMPHSFPPTYTPYNPGPYWGIDQDTQWGPRLPRELTEVKQSVELLRKEVADLKETIRTLETQIQLLSRNILLSERTRENGN
jgi:hypothetical protein